MSKLIVKKGGEGASQFMARNGARNDLYHLQGNIDTLYNTYD